MILSQIAGNEGCPFAIKGGGHAPQAGAANIVSYIFGAISSKHELQFKLEDCLDLFDYSILL